MSATGLEVFDKTLQTTNIWLDEIAATLGPDRQVAWKVLSVVLHKLRDRMPVELAAHLSAELPRVYYDQFEPAKLPTDWKLEEFIHDVSKWLSDVRPINPQDAVRAVFSVLSRHVPRGQIEKVKAALPADSRAFWIAAEERVERSSPARGIAKPTGGGK
jgi:uncharacterized protein (DUF2267 family)